ncbi:hypothetical protein [Tolypothrix sp. VBCCA 56010]
MPNDGRCYNALNPRNALPPQCPMPNAQCPLPLYLCRVWAIA